MTATAQVLILTTQAKLVAAGIAPGVARQLIAEVLADEMARRKREGV